MFDPVTYMQTIHSELALLAGYEWARVSGVSSLEEILEKSRRNSKFFAIDDAQDGTRFMGPGGGYFERRNYTVFILQRCNYGDFTARDTILAEIRTIFRHIHSRIIKDKYNIPVFDPANLPFFEVQPSFATGTCGIYFVFKVENPVDLTYDATAWTT